MTEAGEQERYMEIAESWESEDAWGILVGVGNHSLSLDFIILPKPFLFF
jgi:hypothetical protein